MARLRGQAWIPRCRRCGEHLPEREGFEYDYGLDWRCLDCWGLDARNKGELRQMFTAEEVGGIYAARAEAKARRARSRPPRRLMDAAGSRWLHQARKRIADYGFDSEVREFTKADVVERQGSESCAICGQADDLVLDHVIPLAAAGSHTLDNVRLLCAPCNGWKVAEIDRPLIEAKRGELRRAQLTAA